MDHTEQLDDLHAKIEEVQTQLLQLKGIANALMFEDEDPTHTRFRGFSLDGRPFPNSSEKWVDGFTAICDILSIIYKVQFDKVLDPDNLGLKGKFFAKKPMEGFPRDSIPYEIRDTGILVNTHHNNRTKKRIIERLGELFGCQIFLDYYKPD